jgi:hypothetical protein
VPTLLVGEALIEGIGASLMLPASLAILSNTFQGPARHRVSGEATAGAQSHSGPSSGGFSPPTTPGGAFGINVIVAPRHRWCCCS